MHTGNELVHADAENNGSNHRREDVDVHVTALHQEGLPKDDHGNGYHGVNAEARGTEHEHQQNGENDEREQRGCGLRIVNAFVDVQGDRKASRQQ